MFIVDAEDNVFHVRRVQGTPHVVNTHLSNDLAPRHILVAESDAQGYRALILSKDNSLYLLPADSYVPVRLPLEQYNPKTMDFKILFDPLYHTALWSDATTIHAVAMDTHFTPLLRYEHTMSRATKTWRHTVRDVLFPFSIQTDSPVSRMKTVTFVCSPYWPLWGTVSGISLVGIYSLARRRKRQHLSSCAM